VHNARGGVDTAGGEHLVVCTEEVFHVAPQLSVVVISDLHTKRISAHTTRAQEAGIAWAYLDNDSKEGGGADHAA
jgi:hypothetical protein